MANDNLSDGDLAHYLTPNAPDNDHPQWSLVAMNMVVQSHLRANEEIRRLQAALVKWTAAAGASPDVEDDT